MPVKSIKPGRGPSAMSAIGSVFAVVFGIFWTIMSAKMGAPFFFPLIGVGFVCLGVLQTIYHYKNATGKNRYSTFDITETNEEPDPLQQRFAGVERETTDAAASREKTPGDADAAALFCPYCGAQVKGDHVFCRKCGKKVS